MKYVIWGAGLRGRRLFNHLNKDDVIAFADKSDEKTGSFYCGKKVIGLEEAINKYKNAIIVITHTFENQAVEELEMSGAKNYMRLSDCPGEFQGENAGPYLKNYVKGLINSKDTFVISGCTVYGLEVYSWLLEMGNNHSYLMLENDTPSEMVKLLEQNDYRIIWKNEVHFLNVNSILNCGYRDGMDEKRIFPDIEQKDIYDCSDAIEAYYNPEIEKLKGAYKNEKCVIVATGPSLTMEDLDALAENQMITFGVNKIGYAYASTKWRPTFFVGEDRALMDSEYFRNIRPDEQSTYAFLADTNEEFWQERHEPGILKYHLCDEYTFGRYPKFSEDFSRKSYVGGTIVYTCIQLAVYMGFRDIYLLGVDFTGAKEHGCKYNHFYEEKELTSVSYTDQVKAGYEKARQYAVSHGINIYNATRGGNLEVFERADFDSLF